jgi:hypothetical protein
MNVTKLLAAWPIKGPCQTSPLRRGKNNHVWRVEAADGSWPIKRRSYGTSWHGTRLTVDNITFIGYSIFYKDKPSVGF